MPIGISSVKKSTLIFLIYLSFSLDSLLKVDLKIQVHLGLMLMLIFNCYYILKFPAAMARTLYKEITFVLFFVYCILNGIYFIDVGGLHNLIYILLSVNTLIFVALTFKYWNRDFFYWFQILMIMTGMIQFLLYKIAGFQLAFIDADHYQKASSVAHRLRGFFIEPNWFAIALAFNSLLLLGSQPLSFIQKNPFVSLLTIVVMIVNGTLATLSILILIYSLPLLKKNFLRGLFFSICIGIIFFGAIGFRGLVSEKEPDQSVLNYSSRLIPFLRVSSYQIDSGGLSILFGHGFGSWGTLAIENRLSALVHEEGVNVRDGSEIPVILFEIGLLGIFMIFLDNLKVYLRIDAGDYHLRGGILLFLVCLFLYPTLKFWMYMPYYFYIRCYSLCR